MSLGELDGNEVQEAEDLFLKFSAVADGYSFAVVGTVLANMMVAMVLDAAKQRPSIAKLGIDALAHDMRAMLRDFQQPRSH